MTSVAELIEKKIQDGKLPLPIPAWRCRTRNAVMWTLLGGIVIFGIVSTAVALWFLTDPNGVITEYRNGQTLSYLLGMLPLFWIGISLATAILAVMIFIHAPNGYRYRSAMVIGAIVVAFVAFGGALSAAGFSEKIEAAAIGRIPGYTRVQAPIFMRFYDPGKGRMIGRVKQAEPGMLNVQDPLGREWRVHIPSSDRIFFQPFASSSLDEKCVSIIGVPGTSEAEMKATIIRPCPRGIHVQEGFKKMLMHLRSSPQSQQTDNIIFEKAIK